MHVQTHSEKLVNLKNWEETLNSIRILSFKMEICIAISHIFRRKPVICNRCARVGTLPESSFVIQKF